jgi:hypothetical protein
MEHQIAPDTIESMPGNVPPINSEEENSKESFLAITQEDINNQFDSLANGWSDYQGDDKEIIAAKAKKLREEAMDTLEVIKNAN